MIEWLRGPEGIYGLICHWPSVAALLTPPAVTAPCTPAAGSAATAIPPVAHTPPTPIHTPPAAFGPPVPPSPPPPHGLRPARTPAPPRSRPARSDSPVPSPAGPADPDIRSSHPPANGNGHPYGTHDLLHRDCLYISPPSVPHRSDNHVILLHPRSIAPQVHPPDTNPLIHSTRTPAYWPTAGRSKPSGHAPTGPSYYRSYLPSGHTGSAPRSALPPTAPVPPTVSAPRPGSAPRSRPSASLLLSTDQSPTEPYSPTPPGPDQDTSRSPVHDPVSGSACP